MLAGQIQNPETQAVPDIGDRALNEDQVSVITGRPVKTLRNWRSLGKGPIARKLGGAGRGQRRVVYLQSDVLRWLHEIPISGGEGHAE